MTEQAVIDAPLTDAKDAKLENWEGWDSPAYGEMLGHANKLERDRERLIEALYMLVLTAEESRWPVTANHLTPLQVARALLKELQ